MYQKHTALIDGCPDVSSQSTQSSLHTSLRANVACDCVRLLSDCWSILYLSHHQSVQNTHTHTETVVFMESLGFKSESDLPYLTLITQCTTCSSGDERGLHTCQCFLREGAAEKKEGCGLVLTFNRQGSSWGLESSAVSVCQRADERKRYSLFNSHRRGCVDSNG